MNVVVVLYVSSYLLTKFTRPLKLLCALTLTLEPHGAFIVNGIVAIVEVETGVDLAALAAEP